jgi:hypothetical protein
MEYRVCSLRLLLHNIILHSGKEVIFNLLTTSSQELGKGKNRSIEPCREDDLEAKLENFTQSYGPYSSAGREPDHDPRRKPKIRDVPSKHHRRQHFRSPYDKRRLSIRGFHAICSNQTRFLLGKEERVS